jgi:hypothetical protein
MYRIVFLLLLITISTASKGSSIIPPYVSADDVEMHQNNVSIKLNDDGSVKSLVSIASVELVHTDDKSIKKALIAADILSKVNLSKYITQDISITKSLRAIFNKVEYAKNYITNIKKSSNYLLKGVSVINKTVNKEKKYVSITIEVSDYNMQFVNKAKHILGIKETYPSKELESYIKSLKLINGVRVISFDNKNYIVSLVKKRIKSTVLSSKLNAYRVTSIKAWVNLLKFIHGEKISHSSIRTIENIESSKYSQSKEINKIIETFVGENSGIYSGRRKEIGFNPLKYINNGEMFYYLYLEVPKN